jgi:hypothetical protein
MNRCVYKRGDGSQEAADVEMVGLQSGPALHQAVNCWSVATTSSALLVSPWSHPFTDI